MSDAQFVRAAQPRTMVQVHWSDGRTFEAPVGTPYGEFVRAAYPRLSSPIVGLQVEGSVAELDDPVTRDVTVAPIDMTAGDGMRIYQRAVSFVLVVAVHELFPEARIVIDYAVALGGFFCQVQGRANFTPVELSAIEERMRAIVDADEPIGKERMSLAAASELFTAQGYHDKVRLFSGQDHAEIEVYELRGIRDYFYGSMVSRTGDLRWFGLQHSPDGFILRLPRRKNPTTLPPHREFQKLTGVFRAYGDWLEILGVSSQLAFTVLPAYRALSTGLVNEVFDTQQAMLEAAMQTALEIAARPPVAVWATKQAIDYARDHSVADGLRQMGWLQAGMWDTAAVAEAIEARSERRAAEFADLQPLRFFSD